MDDAETANPGVTVPDDFPHDPFPAALSGAQPKVAARLIDGKYVVGLTEDERRGRYLMCHDLVEQLIEYAERKRTERTDLTLPALLDCRRRSNIDHLCRLNFDQGLLPAVSMLTVDNYKSKVGIPVSLS